MLIEASGWGKYSHEGVKTRYSIVEWENKWLYIHVLLYVESS